MNDQPSVHWSSTITAMVFKDLGIEFDYCWSIDPNDLSSKCDAALCRGTNFPDRISSVREVATWAREHGHEVVWG